MTLSRQIFRKLPSSWEKRLKNWWCHRSVRSVCRGGTHRPAGGKLCYVQSTGQMTRKYTWKPENSFGVGARRANVIGLNGHHLGILVSTGSWWFCGSHMAFWTGCFRSVSWLGFGCASTQRSHCCSVDPTYSDWTSWFRSLEPGCI